MKKFLFYFVLFSFVYVNAQTTIVEEKFKDGIVPLDYHYFPISNKFIIEEGKQPTKVSFSIPTLVINSIISYDAFGKKEILAKNVDWMRFSFSVTENTFKGTNVTKSMFADKAFRYYVNGKFTTTSDFEGISNPYREHNAHTCYNDNYQLIFTDKKSSSEINLKDDELFLTVTDIFTSKSKMISIEKQDMSKLIGDALIKPHKGFIGFNTNIIDNEKFEIITKSISKDYKSSVLYRTNYNMEGKKLNETSFTINLKDYYLIYSYNWAGYTKNLMSGTSGQSVAVFADDLSINNFYEDNTTKDVYIYGLFGTNSMSLNRVNSPSGYYIFKFDKNGTKIWESINLITDKKDFNDDIDLLRLDTDLRFYNDKLYFSVGDDTKKNYVCYSFLDKNTGKIEKENKISYDISFTGKRSLKGYNNKDLGIETFVALDSNKKVADYIKNIKSSETILLNAVFSEKGIWLFETDRKGYYKITLFND